MVARTAFMVNGSPFCVNTAASTTNAARCCWRWFPKQCSASHARLLDPVNFRLQLLALFPTGG